MGEIEIDGRQFAWGTVGHGPWLLLINGYGATGEDWDPAFLGALAASHRVICPDNRGVGGSDLGEGTMTIGGLAGDLLALLDELKIDRLPVAGWSMGGFVAQQLAIAAPERVAALALIATDPGGASAARASAAVWSRLLDHTGTPRERATRLISLLFPPDLAADFDRRFGDLVAAAQERLSPEALRAQEEAMDAWRRAGPPPMAGDQRPPTLVVHGREDIVIPAANAAMLAARWSSEEIQVLADCTHAIMAQQPLRLAELLDRFFAARRRAPR